ncbi:hypothetical protein JX266_014379 [Neoarthrinium moseri]|nr:hypothetical protein JX266_014379 [Neoarthrinium moseri]
MPIDEPLQQKAVDFVASTRSFSAAVFYDPVRQKMDAVMHLPPGEALPDVNRVLKSMSSQIDEFSSRGNDVQSLTSLTYSNHHVEGLADRSKLPDIRATWGQIQSTGTGLPQDNYL